MKAVTIDEVKMHNKPGDMWIAVDGLVYDISKFAPMHPGGERVMRNYAGKDGTEVFFELHRREVLDKYQRLVVARLDGAAPASKVPTLSTVPYSEMIAYQGYKSPYFQESHIAMKKRLREQMSVYYAECHALDVAGKYPTPELYKKFAMTGNLISCLGPGPWLKGHTIAGIKGEDFDSFHEMIFHQENARLASQGFTDGLGGGLGIGLPPVAYFAPPALKKRILTEVLSGDKRICLAISEPYVGSDVAQIKCTAEKTPCGKYYIVNGEKKWITGGVFADYFVTAVRTGGSGMGGISMLLVPRSEGVVTKQIQTSYSQSAGTAYVMFTDVKVPVENLIGKENKGFMCIMANFNHERWGMIVAIAERCRVVIEECFKWAVQRKVFGKPLISQPVVRQKLAEMAAGTESLQHWLDAITYQMCNMSLQEQTKSLGGPMSLLKYHSTRVSCKVADNAAQIFGGRAVTKSGMGYKVEQFIRNYKFSAILGGSEEVMADFAIRQATKAISKDAKL
eukprot:TRINITY_DN12553_c0_g1_i1.p1 TRINITY_DN12553_c0_g1~~TRINITY_DN12553_c0_g1_i1.p1  ORF type:complete len:522 (+),score=201.30 TRINITY_DN12553_c0_g1_i1:43-1566(+)